MTRNRGGRLAALLYLLLWLASCAKKPDAPEGTLVFKREGQLLRTITLQELVQKVPVREVKSHDPYYEKTKRFRAMPVGELLRFVYGVAEEELKKHSFLLTALDGYAVPIEGQKLLKGGAYLAIDDIDVPGFAPIGPRKVSPAPSYLVWEGDKSELEEHPRPWQLATIEMLEDDALYPHTFPRGAAKDSPEMRGYRLFRQRCIRCHALNREGGSIGPDLNVPQSIVAYRPEEQIRAYIKNPLTFRYGVMPANPDLSEDDLSALISYFHAMSKQPYDPQAKVKP